VKEKFLLAHQNDTETDSNITDHGKSHSLITFYSIVQSLVQFFFKQDATFTGDKDNFIHIISAHEERQPQVSIDLTTLRSRVLFLFILIFILVCNKTNCNVFNQL